ncbi:MAG: hypothetical protein FWE69_03110 [Clostridiales bacterium]|nr:hypothetical protein [Clostridiales bacterium]
MVSTVFTLWRTFGQQGESLVIGQTLSHDITAKQDGADTLQAEWDRQRARDAAPVVYCIDPDKTAAQEQDLTRRLAALTNFLTRMRLLWEEQARPVGDTGYIKNETPWLELLPPEALAAALYEDGLSALLDEKLAYTLLGEWLPSASLRQPGQVVETEAFAEAVRGSAAPQWQDGIADETVTSACARAVADIKQTNLTVSQKTLAQAFIETVLTGNQSVDKQATEQKKEEAAARVPAARVTRGQVLYHAGEQLNEDAFLRLRALNLARDEATGGAELTGIALYVAVCYLALAAVLLATRGSDRLKTLLFLTAGLLVVMGLSLLLHPIDARYSPVLLPVLLVAWRGKRQTAMAVNALTAFTLAPLLCAAAVGFFDGRMLLWAAASYVSGEVALLFLGNKKSPGRLLAAGAAGGPMGCLLLVAGQVFTQGSFVATVGDIAGFMAGVLLAAGLAAGAVYAAEHVRNTRSANA